MALPPPATTFYLKPSSCEPEALPRAPWALRWSPEAGIHLNRLALNSPPHRGRRIGLALLAHLPPLLLAAELLRVRPRLLRPVTCPTPKKALLQGPAGCCSSSGRADAPPRGMLEALKHQQSRVAGHCSAFANAQQSLLRLDSPMILPKTHLEAQDRLLTKETHLKVMDSRLLSSFSTVSPFPQPLLHSLPF